MYRFALRATLASLLLCLPVYAEVVRVEIQTHRDLLGGKSFGLVGAYEKLAGKIYFAVDPNAAA